MKETLYKIREIAIATGIKEGTLRSRRIRLDIPANHKGYTLDEVKQMIKKPPAKQFSLRRAEELKQQLKNDGFLPY